MINSISRDSTFLKHLDGDMTSEVVEFENKTYQNVKSSLSKTKKEIQDEATHILKALEPISPTNSLQ